MRVRVRFFAILKDQAGRDATDLELPASATVADALRLLATQHAALATQLTRVAPAVNREYASRDHVLTDGDELALIPAVSGG